MAYDTPTRQRQQRAYIILEQIRNVYHGCKEMQDALALYQSGTDPLFNAAVNTLHTSSERTEINAILTLFQTLTAALESDHATAIGL